MTQFLALVAAVPLIVGCAATQTREPDHQAHHPDGVASAVDARTMPGMTADMSAKMKAMQDMHLKMMAAKTAEERQALMAEHMKAMQGGMGMMKGMSGMSGMGAGATMGKDMPADPQRRMQTMEQRMDMMQMMMEMMMDRMPAGSTPGAGGK